MNLSLIKTLKTAGRYAELAALAVIPTYAAVYALGMIMSRNGMSMGDIGLLQLTTSLAFLGAVMGVHAVLLPRRLGANASRMKWAAALLVLPVLEVGIALAFSYGVQAVVTGFEADFARAIARMASGDGQSFDPTIVRSFAQIPFFVQTLFVNAGAIVLGTLASWPLALKISRSMSAPALAV